MQDLDLATVIARYRTGEEAAAAELIVRFDPYLQKWGRLLLDGRFSRRDEEVRHFLSMLGRMDPATTASILARRLKAYDRQELRHETILVLLQTAIRHDHLTGHYRYALKARVLELITDPLVFGYDRRVEPFGETAEASALGAALPSGTAIDDSWVEGLTCGKGFDQLTERQRRVIQLFYWYGYDQARVADLIGISLRTVEREVSRVKEVLKVHYHVK